MLYTEDNKEPFKIVISNFAKDFDQSLIKLSCPVRNKSEVSKSYPKDMSMNAEKNSRNRLDIQATY